MGSTFLTTTRNKAHSTEANSHPLPGIGGIPEPDFSVPKSSRMRTMWTKVPPPQWPGLPQRGRSVLFLIFVLLPFLQILAGLDWTASHPQLEPLHLSWVSQHGCRDASSRRQVPGWLGCRAEQDAGGVIRQSQPAAVQGGRQPRPGEGGQGVHGWNTQTPTPEAEARSAGPFRVTFPAAGH